MEVIILDPLFFSNRNAPRDDESDRRRLWIESIEELFFGLCFLCFD